MSAVAELCYRDQVRNAFDSTNVATMNHASADATRAVFNVFADYATQDGHTAVTIDRIVECAPYAKRTVQYAIGNLERYAWLVNISHPIKGARATGRRLHIGAPIVPGGELPKLELPPTFQAERVRYLLRFALTAARRPQAHQPFTGYTCTCQGTYKCPDHWEPGDREPPF